MHKVMVAYASDTDMVASAEHERRLCIVCSRCARRYAAVEFDGQIARSQPSRRDILHCLSVKFDLPRPVTLSSGSGFSAPGRTSISSGPAFTRFAFGSASLSAPVLVEPLSRLLFPRLVVDACPTAALRALTAPASDVGPGEQRMLSWVSSGTQYGIEYCGGITPRCQG